ncbi:hypothetical protein F4806DRAFT_492357 [Annulohypoxylon nitens]|nr:hypothetical protein F4806DRAFT_492357 [Annulohypoxylon nitens]
METFNSWYTATPGEEILGSAQRLFKEALGTFSKELSDDNDKLKWITDTNHGNLESILKTVEDVRVQYESHKKGSSIRCTIVELSEKMHYYSGIMDVFVSHHPEYTALAWGAMKFLLVGVVNHQKLINKLSSGLSRVAGILPRADVIRRLYPTPQVKHLIISIYAHILKFLLRAFKWYQESKLKHAIHAITRPAELLFDDITDEIHMLSRDLTIMALTSSHAEQRDVHTVVQGLSHGQNQIRGSVDRLISDIKTMQTSMAASQAIAAASRIQFHQQLSEIQSSQFLDYLASNPLPDPTKAFRESLFFSNRDRQRPSKQGPAFWLDNKIQQWNCSVDSSLVAVKGTRKMRSHIRNFCVQSIAALREAKVPVIWALKTMVANRTSTEEVSTIGLLKYLISQAILVNKRLQNDMALSPHLGAYRAVETEKEWVNMLASVIEGIPLLYIIIDVEVLCQSREGLSEFWPSGLLKMLSDLSARNTKTIVRLINKKSHYVAGADIKQDSLG